MFFLFIDKPLITRPYVKIKRLSMMLKVSLISFQQKINNVVFPLGLTICDILVCRM